jgi:Tol biopolymer transport system component
VGTIVGMGSTRGPALVCVAAGVLAATYVGTSTAEAAVDNHLSLVSVATPEVSPGANGSYTRAVSDDGRFVVFASSQPHLVAGDDADPDGRYVYLRDLQTGTTTRLSHGPGGYLMGNAAIGADGGSVVYPSTEGDEQTSLRLYQRSTGATTVISRPAAASDVGQDWFTVAISDDARYVVYTRTVTSSGDSFETKLYRYDVQTGLTDRPIHGLLGGTVSNPDQATVPSLSADGRFVAFVQSTAPREAVSRFRLVRLDVTTGTKAVVRRSEPQGISQNAFGDPSMSNDGRYIAYSTPDAMGRVSTYVYDARTTTSALASRTPAGTKPNASAGQAQISGDGRYVTFASSATDIAAGTPAVSTIYVYDRRTRTSAAIVRNLQGVLPSSSGAGSSLPYIDGDGSTVVFTSTARNLAVGTTDRLERVFAWDRPGASHRPAQLISR